MTKKSTIIVIGIAILIITGWYFYKKEVGTINIPSKNEQVASLENSKGEPVPYLSVPLGFGISIFAKDVPGARTILPGQGITLDGKTAYDQILVVQTSEGKVTLLGDSDNDGVADIKKTILSGLNHPHGLAAWGEGGSDYLYIAEKDMLSVYDYDPETYTASNKKKLTDLPSSAADRHTTRSLLWLPSGEPDGYSNTLLISVGSSCNVCNEKDQRQGTILSYNIVTNKLETFAKGLRNAVFMALNPVDGKVWATDMGRDGLGDNTPPDEINIIEKGKNYGWPICYGKNIHDTEFDKNTYIRDPCQEPDQTPSHVDLQAHSAPLGLDFIPEEGWPEGYWYNLLVSYHGSWNRSEPTGYKIVRIKLDSKGRYIGTEDFITGFLDKNGKKNGRPADIKIMEGGTAYISDDEAGVIYRLYRTKE